jgi:hypothetical protein
MDEFYNTSSRLRLPDGDVRDEIRLPLYDTVDIVNGEAAMGTRRFFQNVSGKDLTLTNLRQNGALESAVSFKVQGLAIDAQNIYSANKAVLPLIMESSSLQLRIGEKEYWSGPMLFASGRLSYFSARAGAVDAESTYQHFGDVSVAPVILQGKNQVEIAPLQSFQVVWVCSGLTAQEIPTASPSAGAGTKIRFMFSLKGLLRRPVQ